jgi:hypothetical protein
VSREVGSCYDLGGAWGGGCVLLVSAVNKENIRNITELIYISSLPTTARNATYTVTFKVKSTIKIKPPTCEWKADYPADAKYIALLQLHTKNITL